MEREECDTTNGETEECGIIKNIKMYTRRKRRRRKNRLEMCMCVCMYSDKNVAVCLWFSCVTLLSHSHRRVSGAHCAVRLDSGMTTVTYGDGAPCRI